MVIETTRFGEIEVSDGDIIHFPRGLYGLNGTRDYCLVPHGDGSIHWLQAADKPALAMPLLDPFLAFSCYEVEIPDPVAAALEIEDSTDVTVLTSVAVDPDKKTVYTNLLGPLVINRRKGLGVQLVIDGNRYSARQCINAPLEASAVAA
jgi:flagellar assembly factor FliW